MIATRTIVIPCVLGALGTIAATSGAAEAPRDPLRQRFAAESVGDRRATDGFGAEREISTLTVEYATIGDRPVSGYMARPHDRPEPLPALIVIHDRWGLNDNMRAATRRLAANGFAALAVDLYDGRTAATPGQARSLTDEARARPARMERNLRQAFFYLDILPSTARVGSIGWCFGGSRSLEMARRLPGELGAAVVYYGDPITDGLDALRPETPILAHYGADDASIDPALARRFGEALEGLGIPHELHIHEGAGHAFADPTDTQYAERPAAQAWARTIDFLDRSLRHTEAD